MTEQQNIQTPANCVQGLCNLTITHLVLLNPTVFSDLSSVLLAVKMNSSTFTQHFNEMPLSPTGALDTDLQLYYSLQYPHFLKRDGNCLQILLQCRTILGFKTLAVGIVNMEQVLPWPQDLVLDLYAKGHPVARVTLEALSSQAVECDDSADDRMIKYFLADNPDLTEKPVTRESERKSLEHQPRPEQKSEASSLPREETD